MGIPVMLFVVVLFAGASRAEAQTSGAFGGLRIAPKAPTRGALVAGRRNPYSRLFGEPLPPSPRVPPADAQVTTSRRSATPVVKCGMTLVPGDPSIDPGIVTRTPSANARFHSRVAEPTLCR